MFFFLSHAHCPNTSQHWQYWNVFIGMFFFLLFYFYWFTPSHVDFKRKLIDIVFAVTAQSGTMWEIEYVFCCCRRRHLCHRCCYRCYISMSSHRLKIAREFLLEIMSIGCLNCAFAAADVQCPCKCCELWLVYVLRKSDKRTCICVCLQSIHVVWCLVEITKVNWWPN